MRLEPLQEQHTRLLVQRILPPDAWNEHAVARIVRAAGGNPLFVEELLTAFVDEGAESENGMTVARTIQAADIPISIMALLGARLERLPPQQQRALELGSIEGEVFHRGAVTALARIGEDEDPAGSLQTLVDQGVIGASFER